MRTCPDYKQRSRPGEYVCGARKGVCHRKDDETIECPIRDAETTPAMKELSDGVQKIFRDAVGRAT